MRYMTVVSPNPFDIAPFCYVTVIVITIFVLNLFPRPYRFIFAGLFLIFSFLFIFNVLGAIFVIFLVIIMVYTAVIYRTLGLYLSTRENGRRDFNQ
jgi:uncharacterized membrane protein